MKNPNMRAPAIGAFLVALALVVFASTYVLKPGQAALVLRNGQVSSGQSSPGLHWKWPLLDRVIILDTRVRLVSGQSNSKPKQPRRQATPNYAYTLAWRISSPRVYYRATHDNPASVGARFNAVAQKVFSNPEIKEMGTVTVSVLEGKLLGAARAEAAKLGITLEGVYITAASLPDRNREQIVAKMTTVATTRLTAAKLQIDQAVRQIRQAAADKREALLVTAQIQAAKVRGGSEAQVAEWYAQAERRAPGFFRFFFALEEERRALFKGDTRVVVISTASPWFKTLDQGNGKQRKH